jgi:flavin reductase (DIM6/NTAB) family NADH-FMN oxidoreductase RutF
MVAVLRESKVFECLAESRAAVLHIVGDRQQEIARRFFYPTHAVCGTINGEAFMEGRTAAPVLPNLPAYIECRVERIVDTNGDHAVVILKVVEAECRDQVRPLTMADTPWVYGG